MEFKVYLAGPISGLSFDESENWRDYVKAEIDPQIKCFSPLRGKQERLREGTITDTYEDHPLTSAKGIYYRDQNDVRTCDALFVFLKGAKKISIGTIIEIAWAQAFNKPIILVAEADNIHLHAMATQGIGWIVDNIDSGITMLETILLP